MLLILMFPLPEAFIGLIAFPLKIIVAEIGILVAGSLGIPVFREGFHITIPEGSLLVDNPCSGLRSLLSFVGLGAVYAYFSNLPIFRRLFLFLISVPVAVLSNIIRVVFLIMISHYWGLAAAAPDSFWHDASGMFVFVLGMVLMFIIGKGLEWNLSGTDI